MHGRLPEWPKGAVCKTAGSAYVGSNPTPATPTSTCGNPVEGRRVSGAALLAGATTGPQRARYGGNCRWCHVSSLVVRELFTKRKKAADEAAARARGEKIDYLVADAPQEFRYQLWYALQAAFNNGSYDARDMQRAGFGALHAHLREEYGVGRLSKSAAASDFVEDLGQFVLQDATTPKLMDVIDGAMRGVSVSQDRYLGPQVAANFYTTVRRRMSEHKLAYDIVGGQVVEKDSEELHQEVVVPALTLLHGRSRFKDAERQHREALDELAKENWADAITDANAAVEVVARTVLGFQQGQLPGMLQELRKQGLLGDPQEGRLRKVVDGFSELADIRNKEGDAHGNTSDRGTAWLAVHWAGALIVYLVEQAEERGL